MLLISVLQALPFLWSHVRGGLESTEERAFIGETRLQPNSGNLQFRGFQQQLFGVLQTVVVHILAEGAALMTVDAYRNSIARYP